MNNHFSVSDIKSRIFKDSKGISNYINVSIEEMDWLVEQAEKLDKFVYVNEQGEPKITTKELMLLLMDFQYLKEENEKLKNAEVERLEEYIGQLEHENKLLYGRLNMIRDLTNKEVK